MHLPSRGRRVETEDIWARCAWRHLDPATFGGYELPYRPPKYSILRGRPRADRSTMWHRTQPRRNQLRHTELVRNTSSERKDWRPEIKRAITRGPGFRNPSQAGSARSSAIPAHHALSHHSRYLRTCSRFSDSETGGDQLGFTARRKWHQKWHRFLSLLTGRRMLPRSLSPGP
jgi:hypothetical protein